MTAVCGILFGALALVEGLPCPPPPDAGVSGYFSRYDEAPTVGTLAYRQAVGDIPLDLSPYAGLIAVADCGLIGAEAWVDVGDGRGWLPVLVMDCAGHASTVDWMQRDGIIAELDWFLAESIGYTCRCGWPGRLYIEGHRPMKRYQKDLSDEFRQRRIELTQAMIAEARAGITELEGKYRGNELEALTLPLYHMIDEWNEDLKELEN